MATVSILIKTDRKLKEEAKKTAEEMGISLTSVINRYLKHFIQAKSITFSIDDEIPNQYMVDSLGQSEEAYKAGKAISFDTQKELNEHFDTLIEHATHN